jgi:hypothetical protein
MSGHIGLREEARAGHQLALRIAWLFRDARHGQWAGGRVDSRRDDVEELKDERTVRAGIGQLADGRRGAGR